jgi:hypothetical protein
MLKKIGLMVVACLVLAPLGAAADTVDCFADSALIEPPECLDGGPGSGGVLFNGKARLPGDTAYAQDIGFVSDDFISFPLADMTQAVVIATNAVDSPFSMDYDPSATTLWAIDNASNSLGHWNTATGTFSSVVPLTGYSGTMEGLAIDPTDGAFYFASTDGSTSWLYSLDENTGVCTLIGVIPGATLIFEIKIDNNGVMYGHEGGADVLIEIDKTTAASTVIGPTGFAANFAQGMDFDPSDNTLYAWIYTGGGTGSFCSFNLATGACSPLSWRDGEWVGGISVAAGPPAITYVSHDGVDDCASNAANVNGIWEPGEEIALDVEIMGGGDFTGVTGTLVATTPDVAVPGDMTTWPDLVSGVPAWSDAPFQVVLGETVPCFSRVSFELTLNANEGGPWTYTFGNEIGQPLEPNVPVDIPDNGGPGGPGISTLVVGDDMTLADVNVWMQIDHTWVGDVAMSLRSPAGTEVLLLDRPGVPASTYGCSDNNMDITFDDDSAFDPENHCDGTDPWYVGDALPIEALAAFNGESSMGTWELVVWDNAGGDTGQIVDWDLITDPPIGGTCVICEQIPDDRAIPTLNTLGLLVLIGILVGAGLVMIRRT